MTKRKRQVQQTSTLLTNLHIERSDVELSGATVRLIVLPKHLPEHKQHLRGTEAHVSLQKNCQHWISICIRNNIWTTVSGH